MLHDFKSTDDGSILIERDLEIFKEILNVVRTDGNYQPKFHDFNKQSLFDIEKEYWGLNKKPFSKDDLPKELLDYIDTEPKKLTPIDVWRKLGPIDIEHVFKQSPFRFGNDLEFGSSKDGYKGLLLDKKRHGVGR